MPNEIDGLRHRLCQALDIAPGDYKKRSLVFGFLQQVVDAQHEACLDAVRKAHANGANVYEAVENARLEPYHEASQSRV